jgi:uncharacterized membrane protein YphA (DoxX/SURF4 family)
MRKGTWITLWVASVLLATLFLIAGIAKFASPAVADQFLRWGYTAWFRVLIGIIEVGCGLMLLVPRFAWRSALVLGVVMLGAAITLWWHEETTQALLPATVLLTVSMVGYARHPRATLMRRLRNAVDWVAEREMEEQRRKIAIHQAMKALKRPIGQTKRSLANRSGRSPHVSST